MALYFTHKEVEFGIGDVVRVHQRISELGKKDEQKSRIQIFEGTVIKIQGRDMGKSFTVRRIGAQKIGIEQIYPLAAPVIEKVEIVKKGMRGTRRAKLYYIRDKSKRDIDAIYSRANRRTLAKETALKQKASTPVVKKTTKKKAK